MVCDSKREYSATATVNRAPCLETRPIDTFDAAAQRWLVHLDGSDAVKLKPENLEAAGFDSAAARDGAVGEDGSSSQLPAAGGLKPGTQVTLRGLTKRPELNGRAGLLETFDAAAQRWLVHLDGSDAVKLKPENLEALGKVSFLQKR